MPYSDLVARAPKTPIVEWLKLDEVSARLRVCPKTIRRWLASGELAGSRMPSPRGRGHWRISTAEVDRFTKQRSKRTS